MWVGAGARLVRVWKRHVPELPDITVYLQQLRPRILDQPLTRIVIRSPFVLRSVDPSPGSAEGKRVVDLRRVGKRIVFVLEGNLFVVIHLMIAGRFHWKPLGAKLGGRQTLASFEFPNGSLQLTEACTKRRASIHLVAGEDQLAEFERGGLEVLSAKLGAFRSGSPRKITPSNEP